MIIQNILKQCNDTEKLFNVYKKLFLNDKNISEVHMSELKVQFAELYKKLISLVPNNKQKAIVYIVPHCIITGDFKTGTVSEFLNYDVLIYDGEGDLYLPLCVAHSEFMGYKLSDKSISEMDAYEICAYILFELSYLGITSEYQKQEPSILFSEDISDKEKEFYSELAEKNMQIIENIRNEYLQIAKKEYEY